MSVEAPERIWVWPATIDEMGSSVDRDEIDGGVEYVRADKLEELDTHRRKVIAENERLLYSLIEANRKLEELADALAHANHMQRLTQDARNKAEAALAERDKQIAALRDALEKIAAPAIFFLSRKSAVEMRHAARTALARNAGGGDAQRHDLTNKLKEAKAAYDAMTEAEKEAMKKAQLDSWMRGMAPCEHGVLDWETCPDCRREYGGKDAE